GLKKWSSVRKVRVCVRKSTRAATLIQAAQSLVVIDKSACRRIAFRGAEEAGALAVRTAPALALRGNSHRQPMGPELRHAAMSGVHAAGPSAAFEGGEGKGGAVSISG